MSAADRQSPLNGSRSPSRSIPVHPTTVLLRPARLQVTRRRLAPSSISQFSDGRNRPRIIEHKSATARRSHYVAPTGVAAANVGDDFTLGRHRCGLKSEILATRRAACETALGVNHCLAFSYVLLQHQQQPRRRGSCIDLRRFGCDLFLAHVRVAAVSQ